MPAPFQPRRNYRAEAVKIHKIIAVLEIDEVSDPAWVEEATEILHRAMIVLVNQKLKSDVPSLRSKRNVG